MVDIPAVMADHTPLTTQQMLREVLNLREFIETRLDGMDKAVGLLQIKADQSPTIGEVVERLDAFVRLVAEKDKRFGAEFLKLGTIQEMMTEQQALALAATKEAVAVAMNASEKAVAKAENAAEKRFEAVNEFRSQLADQQQTFARQDLVTQRADGLEKKMDEMFKGLESGRIDNKERIALIEGSSAATARLFGLIAAGIATIATLIGIFTAFT